MKQIEIPCLLMRGGTSRGPYFNRKDLPENLDELAEVLISVVGSGHALNIDGIGGGNAVTTKVAMLSKSSDSWADIDYFFAQVSVEDRKVDFSPTCGNILTGVAPAAIELGLISPNSDTTSVNILSTNTGARVEAIVQTPKEDNTHYVNYHGTQEIIGVPGSAAPIGLNFMDIVGSKTDALFPTGNSTDVFDDKRVTCIDVAMPMVIGLATDFGITGNESSQSLNDNKRLFDEIESVRIQAGKKMGLGDVSQSVVPKFALISPPEQGGSIQSRYFMPWSTHPAYAVTGAICTASCLLAKGTIAENIADVEASDQVAIGIEHPSGILSLTINHNSASDDFEFQSAGIVRTARKLFSGSVAIPAY